MSIHESDKLAPRALQTVFIGYSISQKGYKLLDPITQQIHISRHVVFTEDVFPCLTNLSCSDSLPFSIPTTSYCDDSHDTPLDTFFLANPTSDSPSSSELINHTSTPELSTSSTSPPLSALDTSSPPHITTDSLPPQRISLRHKIQPNWMKDYVVPVLPSTVSRANAILLDCPINPQKYSYSHYSPSTEVFACAVSHSTVVPEPHTFNQAKTKPRWIDAMQKELLALETNDTWTIVDSLPQGKRVRKKSNWVQLGIQG
ncbi:uncharacterized protein LOC141674316 [Apium graveolens]|uniref:uncharacterized protein LOC141674316 n=1 Tax=Apium graveolens TaxID=4045 RepID=UPI003D7B46DA